VDERWRNLAPAVKIGQVSKEALIRRALDAFNERDLETLYECVDPKLTVRRPFTDLSGMSQSMTGDYHGLRDLRRIVTEMDERLGGFQVEARQFDELDGDRVLLEFLALIGPRGSSSAQLGWVLIQMRGDVIASTETFTTEAGAREAIERGD
jgi:ketosteroid isomerase-like protein